MTADAGHGPPCLFVEGYGAGDAFVSDVMRNTATPPPAISSLVGLADPLEHAGRRGAGEVGDPPDADIVQIHVERLRFHRLAELRLGIPEYRPHPGSESAVLPQCRHCINALLTRRTQ